MKFYNTKINILSRQLSKRSCFFIFLMISLYYSIFSFAANSVAEEKFSLNSAVEEAKRSNPEILAAKNNYQAARMRVPQALFPEDPMVAYSYDEIRAGVPDLMGKPMRSYVISQRIPFPTKLVLRSQIASKDAKILYESYKDKERDIIARTKIAYFELWKIEKSIDITAENEVILEQFATSTASRYAVGKSTQQDALKAQVEIAKINNSLTFLDQKRQVAQARLNILLNRMPDSSLITEKELKTAEVTRPLENFYKMAKENSPRLKAFKYAIDKGRLEYLMAWNEFLPDISGNYEQMIDDGSGGKWAGMIGISVPIWFWAKQSSEVGQMKSELDMFKAEYNMMENMTLFDVKEAYARIEAYKKLAETFETSFIPQVEQTLKSSLMAYEANQIDFLNLLDSQRMLLEIKLDYYDAIAEFETAKAALEKTIGTDL